MTEVSSVDLIEVVGEYAAVQVRMAHFNTETGDIRYSRYVLHPHMDISSQPENVQAKCQEVWTPEIVSGWNEFWANQT